MKETIRRILLILSVLLLLVGGLIRTVSHAGFKNKTDSWKDFRSSLAAEEVIVDGVIRDNQAFTIISTEGRRDFGNLFVVFSREGKRWIRTYENDFEALKPWKLELADVDGDGTTEILIAVKKSTHFDLAQKNRMFIFNYDGEKLIKKWTGSKAAGDWEDFAAGDLLPIPGDELIFSEKSKDKKVHISIYYWFDFGFLKLMQSADYKEIQSFKIIGKNKLQIIYGKEKKIGILTVKDGKLAMSEDSQQ